MWPSISQFLWQFIARIVCIPAVTDWLIARAQRTPYKHIYSYGDLYMGRWWLFNPQCDDEDADAAKRTSWRAWIPSIRVHHIVRADLDRHLHDHPRDARTIVMRNWYDEERPESLEEPGDYTKVYPGGVFREVFRRGRGYTGRLLFGQYHRISRVPPDGVWTLFFTWKKLGAWGFNVDGVKVLWRDYLGLTGRAG